MGGARVQPVVPTVQPQDVVPLAVLPGRTGEVWEGLFRSPPVGAKEIR